MFTSLKHGKNLQILESLNLAVVSAGIQFFFPLLISRLVGLSEFGGYTLIFQQALLLRLFIGFALEEATARELPLLLGDGKCMQEFVKAAIAVKIATYTLTLTALCSWIYIFKQPYAIQDLLQSFTLVAFAILLDAYISSQSLLRSLLYLKQVEVAELMLQLSLIIVSFVVVPWFKSVYSIVAAYSAVLICFTFINMNAIGLSTKPFETGISVSYQWLKLVIKLMLNYGLPLLLAALFYWVISVYDRFQISLLLNNRSAGVYSLGSSMIAAPLNIIVVLTLRTLQPIFFTNQERFPIFPSLIFIRDAITARINLILLSAMSVITLSIFIVYSGMSDLLEDNTGLSIPLVIGLLITGLSQGCAAFATYLLKYERKTKFIALSLIIPCLFVWLINPYIIRNYGIIGAAYSSAFGFSIFALSQLVSVGLVRTSSRLARSNN